MSIILFEDEQVEWLYPITISKPAFIISCGSYRLIDLVGRLGWPLHWIIREHLRHIQDANFEQEELARGLSPPLVLVNASLVPSAAVARQLEALVHAARPGIVRTGTRVAAAYLAPDSPAPPDNGCVEEMAGYFSRLELPELSAELPLFEYPHDVVRQHMAILPENLADRLARQPYREVADGVFVSDDVQLGQHIVTDTSKGPILLEHGASIGPYCYLNGPAHVGQAARIIEHAAIKDGVALGHTTKIGGEVEASIVEPYTNKQHHGFLGHSYLGSWINLGAGTCNSDLKNTYGQVNMEYRGRKVATGMQFLGCIMGDYAKTAINTGIFTGKTIGACSMLYGFVTTNVPSFVNYARLFGQVTETPVDVMIATQARMFARRNVIQRTCDVQLLQDMYRLTQKERQIGGEPLAF
jgi:glucose-1-phosphate thymidylyltransferase